MSILNAAPSQGFRPGKKTFLGLAIVVMGIVGVSVWFYVDDLMTRFPDLDFHRSRVGIASWYSRTDKGIHKRTANNEIFDDKAMTCASWDYPFGEELLVINTLNGNWVMCRVNDHGPAVRLRRTVDLTRSAFKKISGLGGGLIYVTVIPMLKHQGPEKRSSLRTNR